MRRYGVNEIVCCKHGKKCSGDAPPKSSNESSRYESLSSYSSSEPSSSVQTEKKDDPGAQFACIAEMDPRMLSFLRSDINDSDLYQFTEASASRMSIPPKTPVRNFRLANEGMRECGQAREAYIGVQTYQRAEDKVKKRTSFMLYHQLPTVKSMHDLDKSTRLRLFVVYRTATGSFRHYPIESHERENGRMYHSVQMNVYPSNKRFQPYHPPSIRSRSGDESTSGRSKKDDEIPVFESLDALVRYYNTYVTLRCTSVGEVEADIFNW